jgi:dGTPase
MDDTEQESTTTPLVPTDRNLEWASTMKGASLNSGIVLAHKSTPPPLVHARVLGREAREELQAQWLSPGATLSSGAGNRAREEAPDSYRTCFERDRDRILHASAFRRLAGKTQVFVFPADHQRTRMTHALEVAQVTGGIARAAGLNVALAEAIALGHDCGHGPGGHASEDAFDPFLPGGFHHAIWGAEVTLAPLNLCAETLDGIRNHSWSLPTPATPEGAVVSWSDRIAYTCHDLEDAVAAGVVALQDLPDVVHTMLGTRRSSQLRALMNAVVDCIASTGMVGMTAEYAEALAALRKFNYDNIYMRPDSLAQASAVISVLQALVEFFAENPDRLPDYSGSQDPVRAAVSYVSGMTDRFAFETAVSLLGWDRARLPRGVDMPIPS